MNISPPAGQYDEKAIQKAAQDLHDLLPTDAALTPDVINATISEHFFPLKPQEVSAHLRTKVLVQSSITAVQSAFRDRHRQLKDVLAGRYEGTPNVEGA